MIVWMMKIRLVGIATNQSVFNKGAKFSNISIIVKVTRFYEIKGTGLGRAEVVDFKKLHCLPSQNLMLSTKVPSASAFLPNMI